MKENGIQLEQNKINAFKDYDVISSTRENIFNIKLKIMTS